MRIVHVLLDEKDNVLGTSDGEPKAGTGAPTARLVPRDGQRVVDVRIDDELNGLEPAKFYQELKSRI
ncbi:hypothetical protein [Actinoplanes subtropicus]|jgi:hypothetical protein|uniref:hypothetical protein n=1 Tax=Actinoplanes subtropicus TaxID=543632 RepID=UPI0004C467AA|nr:hypothetical protein [Actinoplanes subtropicus]